MWKCTPRTRNAPPSHNKSQFLGQFLLDGLDLEVYLDGLWGRRLKKAINFFGKKCTPRQNPGYAYGRTFGLWSLLLNVVMLQLLDRKRKWWSLGVLHLTAVHAHLPSYDGRSATGKMHGVAFGYVPTFLLDAVVPVSMLRGRAHLRSADNGTIRRTTNIIVGRFQGFLRCWSTSVESAPTPVHHIDCIAAFKRHLKLVFLQKRAVRLIK